MFNFINGQYAITVMLYCQVDMSYGCVKFLSSICLNRGLREGRGGRGRGFLCILSLLSQVGVDFSKIP